MLCFLFSRFHYDHSKCGTTIYPVSDALVSLEHHRKPSNSENSGKQQQIMAHFCPE